MADVIVSRSIPIEPGRKPADRSISVTLPTDQGELYVVDATTSRSEVRESMFGFETTERRQFLLQELPAYGIDLNVWSNIGNVNYIPSIGGIELTVPAATNSSTHQTQFAFKYQPGKQISISQAVQVAMGPAIANSIIQWGEFTRRDGYGWRLMTKDRGVNLTSDLGSTNIRPWDNYLYFFRRTSAIPASVPSTKKVTVDVVPEMSTSTNSSVLVGDSLLYRPSYLVGTDGLNTTYIDLDTWEDLAYTSVVPTQSTFNCDKYTGLSGDGIPGIDQVRGTSAKQVSTITTSYVVTGCTYASNSTTITCNTYNGTTQILTVGMSVRGTGIPSGAVITIVNNGNISISANTTAAGTNATVSFNEVANLAMFLIQRSWYGGSGGRCLIYMPDQNPPYNGGTRWVKGHEIRIGDTLPVASMSSPDMPVTYLIGKRAGNTTTDVNAFLRRFGVSVWIDGGDPRPAKIESASATGVTVSNGVYTPMLALAVKPWIWNSSIPAKRPQRSRVYPYKLLASSTQNTEIYFIKGSVAQISSLNNSNTSWYLGQNLEDNLKVVATTRTFTATINSSSGYPSGVSGKLIGAFYVGANESVDIDLQEIFDPQRELLGRGETSSTDDTPGDTLLIICRSLVANTNAIASVSLIYGVQ
jgi:hypothetical protein